MPIVIRYQCHACNAPVEKSGEAWTRCEHCRALVGFDFQAWFESADYKRWLAQSASMIERWKPYQELEAEAQKLGNKGKLAEAVAKERAAQELLLELSPHVFPPEVKTDAAYREKYLALHAFLTLHQKVDRESCKLNDELMGVLRGLDYRDPMKAVRPAAQLMVKMMRRLEQIPGAPEDPDAMPQAARLRVWSSLFLSAYLHMLTKRDDRLEILRTIHGRENVVVVGDASQDETGLYKDWLCPRCGLASMQARSAPEYTCPGCMFRKPAKSGASELPAESARCPTCGAQVQIAAGALDGECGYCKIPIRRMARTGDAERDFAHKIMAQYGAPSLPEEGVAGFAVTDGNREELVLTGLARQACWYARMISPERYLSVVRKSFPALSDPERAKVLERVAAAGKANGESEESKRLLADSRRALDPAAK